MISALRIEKRPEQPYMAIRTQVSMHELPTVIPQLMDEVIGWLNDQAVPPAGAPFIRYHVINMADKLDIELGWPVASSLAGNGRISAGVIPAGQYATLLYTGDYSGLMEANGVLIEWAREQGIAWDCWDTGSGDGFAGRFEFYLTDPAEEPDPAKWETEVTIKLADHQPV